MNNQGRFAEIDKSFTEWDRAKIAVLPVPYDKTSTWVKGADKGPFAILKASQALELYDIETNSEVYKQGIHTCPVLDINSPPEEMVKQVQEKVSNLLDSDKFTVVIGGEHSVSIGSIMSHLNKYKNISILQLDAHPDLRDEYKGSRYNHACVGMRIKEMCPIIQVGFRSMDIEEKGRNVSENMFSAEDIVKNDSWIENVLERLSDDVYVTIDLDVFDSSIMPSTGTPEPGGLDWGEVTGLLKKVSEKKNVLGFDVVELCPNEQNKAPDFLAAKLIYKFLSYIYSNKG